MSQSQPAAGQPIRILHLEDSVADAKLCAYRLRDSELVVEMEVARNGQEFREKMQAKNYDLVMGDYRLPDCTGLEAAQWLRLEDPHTPFILVTGTLGDELAVECIKKGVTDYVLKDKLDRLPFAILRALEERATRAERDRVQRELQEREQEYRSIIEGAPYGIYRAEHDGKMLMANPELAAMLGYENEAELLNLNTVEDLFVDHTERLRALSQVQSTYTRSEHRWRRKDGVEITVRLAGRKLPQLAGKAPIYEIFVEDITAQRSLEQQFLQAQKMEAIGRLAGGVAHDFNNLLMIISSCIELWQDQRNDPKKAGEYIAQIKESISMATFVTRQLLTFSRKQVTEHHVIDLNSILKDFTKMLPRLLGEDVEVVMAPGLNLQRVNVDRGHIEQVIMNLAVNARDAMPKGGKLIIETANVQLDADRAGRINMPPGHYVCLTVTDTGTGMDAATQVHIFEPFFTTKERGKGTGLGLATVYAIVKENGGNILVRSELGKGSSFELYFPSTDNKHQLPQPLRTVASPEAGQETILIVEDESALRAITAEYLQAHSYEVLTARNGVEALEICGSHQGLIHVMVTDVVMPGISGPELAKAAMKARPDLKVIYVSGYIDRQVDREALGPEAIFLQKPFELADLSRRIRQVLITSPRS
jgi:two-component system cell cycle sensor histidine kinase/response regulator CckA